MNFTKTIKIAALCTLPLILTACGGDDSSPTLLEGSWVSSCEPEIEQNTSGSGIVEFIFKGDEVTAKITSYIDSKCTNEYAKTKMTSNFSIGKIVDSKYTELNLTFKSIELSSSDSETYNNQKYLGIDNWKDNTYVDITHNEEYLQGVDQCNGDADCKVGAKGVDIFKIKGNHLYFGNDQNIPENDRPTQIDFDHEYTKN